MALLHGAAEAAASGARTWRLTVAHLDHGLRPSSAQDAEFVADAAARLGLTCELRGTDVAALARAEGRSVEDAGREARYRFLEEVSPVGAVIATAHTLDDQAETVLLNLLRGSGLRGAGGMPARRGRIVRPLLGERRADLRAALDGARLAYRLDPSNEDRAYLRNRVRADVLPLLEAVRPGVVQRLAEFARLATDDDGLLDELAGAELEKRRGSDGWVDWRDPPAHALGRRMLRLAIGDPAPSAERIEAFLAAAAGERGGARIELGGGRVGAVRQRRVRIEG